MDHQLFIHGQDDTHYACDQMVAKHGGKVRCCGCTGHTCQPIKITPNEIHTIIDTKRQEIKRLKREILALRSQIPGTKLQKRGNWPIRWEASLNGWHNPRKHLGLTSDEFFNLYLKGLHAKKHPLYKQLAEWFAANRAEAISYIETTFHKTISHPAKP